MRRGFVLAMALALPMPIFGQIWEARYNGPADSTDCAYAIAVDGEYVYVTGESYDLVTKYDYVTVKYNSSGDALWEERYNGSANFNDWAEAIAVDGDGNVYVTGMSAGSGTSADYATVKYDSSGDSVWVARYNGPINKVDAACAIAVDNSGNVYVTGYSEIILYSRTDYVTVKYNSLGEEQWAARYNGPGNYDYAEAIAVDGEYVYVTGKSYDSLTGSDYATVKYNTAGVEQWVARYNGPGDSTDCANAIAVDGEGNVYVTGYSEGSGTEEDYATVKYDSSGDSVWVARYNGPGNGIDYAWAIAVDGSGNVYVTGRSWGSGTGHDYATVKYGSSGDSVWVARYDSPISGWDGAQAIAVDGEGNVYVTGESGGSGTGHDYATIRYNSSGVEQWVERYDGPDNDDDEACAIAVDGEYVYVTGESRGSGTGWDYATIKYSCTGIEEMQRSREARLGGAEVELEVYPNLFGLQAGIRYQIPVPSKVSLNIYDVSGRLIKTLVDKPMETGSYTATWNAKSYPSGIYFAELKAGDYKAIRKLILMK